jgi:hypothetical protein
MAKGAEHTDPGEIAGNADGHEAGPADAQGALVPTTSDEALRIAITLAVDAGEYDRAATLIEVVRHTAPKPASVTTLTVARAWRRQK